MKRTFLYQVWQHNKKLFYIMVAFSVLTIATNLAGDQVTPFFVWGMYSEKEEPVQQYSILQTVINDSILVNPYELPVSDTRFYLTSPLAYYKKIKDNNNTDPTISFLQSKLNWHVEENRMLQKLFNAGPQRDSFFTWYARYLSQVTLLPVHSIRIDNIKAHYTESKLIADTTHLLYRWEKP
jgi:hypothetical protein